MGPIRSLAALFLLALVIPMIAAHAAGQIPFYSERYTLDLLGKSDPVVARSPTKTFFRPGHNKWNYEHSIVETKPDIIADHWGNIGRYIENSGLDYEAFTIPGLEWRMYVKRGSPKIRWELVR